MSSSTLHLGHRARWNPVVLGLLILLLGACTARPIPTSVQAGSTFVFPIAGDDSALIIGYDSVDLGYQDFQFGRTLFVLMSGGQEVVLTGTDPVWGGDLHPLTTRWITRAYPDRASPAGIANQPIFSRSGQVIAVIDVHPDTPAGPYTWKVRTELRPEIQAAIIAGTITVDPNTSGELFRFFAQSGQDHMETFLGEFNVLPATVGTATGETTPSEGVWSTLNFDLQQDMKDLIPYPKAVFGFGQTFGPAAAFLQLGYPVGKIAIKEVFEQDSLGQGSMIRWVDDAGSLEIHLVDPDQKVTAIAVAFELVDAETTGPAVPSDFSVNGEAYYNLNGTPNFGFFALQDAGVW